MHFPQISFNKKINLYIYNLIWMLKHKHDDFAKPIILIILFIILNLLCREWRDTSDER